MTKIQSEIEYIKEDGTKVHANLCPIGCNYENIHDIVYREYLHICLDEWLNKSRGTGGFYIKAEDYKFNL